MQDHHPLNPPRQAAWLLVVLLLLSLCACRERRDNWEEKQAAQITIADIAVPVFASAEEQLTYTRAWFAEPAAKRAALLAFLRLYPERKRYCGLAALDLAYLELGEDYRLAREHDGFAAIKAYKEILVRYAAFPQIQAKANWYIGWIYADLLADRDKAGEYFLRVVSRYPDEEVALLPPAPWVSIIHPGEEPQGEEPPDQARNTWAALALVELIRHAEDDELAWSSFSKLWRDYRQDVAAGFGLRLILQRRVHVDEALVMAREYMERYFANVHLLGDIQKLINDIESGGEA